MSLNLGQSSFLEDQESVELYLSCRNIPARTNGQKRNPMIKLHKQIDKGKYSLVGFTESVQNDHNPDFVKSFRLEFIFETK